MMLKTKDGSMGIFINQITHADRSDKGIVVHLAGGVSLNMDMTLEQLEELQNYKSVDSETIYGDEVKVGNHRFRTDLIYYYVKEHSSVSIEVNANFIMSADLRMKITDILGVENITRVGKYATTFSVGDVFEEGFVKDAIDFTIEEHLKENEKPKMEKK